MTGGFDRGRRLRTGLAALTVAAAILPVSTVMADDAGGRAFFLQEAGYGRPEAPRPAFVEPVERPLVVKRRRQFASRPAEVKVAVGPKGPVSIYEDQTLRAGDAVMTAKGLRVFVGDRGATHAETDFVALSEADGLPKQVQKALVIIDKAPHG